MLLGPFSVPPRGCILALGPELKAPSPQGDSTGSHFRQLRGLEGGFLLLGARNQGHQLGSRTCPAGAAGAEKTAPAVGGAS